MTTTGNDDSPLGYVSDDGLLALRDHCWIALNEGYGTEVSGVLARARSVADAHTIDLANAELARRDRARRRQAYHHESQHHAAKFL